MFVMGRSRTGRTGGGAGGGGLGGGGVAVAFFWDRGGGGALLYSYLTRLACGKLERDLAARIRENGAGVARAAGRLPVQSMGQGPTGLLREGYGR